MYCHQHIVKFTMRCYFESMLFRHFLLILPTFTSSTSPCTFTFSTSISSTRSLSSYASYSNYYPLPANPFLHRYPISTFIYHKVVFAFYQLLYYYCLYFNPSVHFSPGAAAAPPPQSRPSPPLPIFPPLLP